MVRRLAQAAWLLFRALQNRNMAQIEEKLGGSAQLSSTGASVREEFVSFSGCRVRYLTAGSGPAIVFIHGLLGYSFSWRFNLAAFAKHFSVYALDLPGVGFSERTRGPKAGLVAITQEVSDFLKQLAIKNAVLVGSSHGGAIAMMIAARAREHGITVPRLVLVSPVNPWSRQGAGRAAFFGSCFGGALLRCAAPIVPLTHSLFLKRMYGDPHRMTAETLAGYDSALRVPGTLPHMLGRVRHWSQGLEAIRTALSAIADIPTLLVWGSEDRAVPLASAAPLKENFRRAELAVIKGAGHLPYEEMPEEFNRVVLGFLRRDEKIAGSPSANARRGDVSTL